MPYDRNGQWVDSVGDGGGNLSTGVNTGGDQTQGISTGNVGAGDPVPNIGSGGSGFSLGNIGNNIGDAGRLVAGVGGIASGLVSGAVIAPKVAQAGKDAAAMANPFQGNNQYYIDRMNALQKDPSEIANTPGYKFALDQGLGAIAGQDVRKFGLGAGSGKVDEMKYASGLASETYDKEMARLMQLSGANWNPSAGASNLMTGALGSASLQQSGINQAMQGFSNLLAPNGTTNNNNNGTPGSGGGKPTWPVNKDGSPDYTKMTPKQFDDYLKSKGVTRDANGAGDQQNDQSINPDLGNKDSTIDWNMTRNPNDVMGPPSSDGSGSGQAPFENGYPGE